MLHKVEIDREALAAEAAEVNVGDEPAPGAAPEPEVIVDETRAAERKAQQAAPVIERVLDAVHMACAPNWTVAVAQKRALAESLAYALALWFPRELPPKWAALLGVAVSAWGIVESNRDESGRLKPFYAESGSDGAGNAS